MSKKWIIFATFQNEGLTNRHSNRRRTEKRYGDHQFRGPSNHTNDEKSLKDIYINGSGLKYFFFLQKEIKDKKWSLIYKPNY